MPIHLTSDQLDAVQRAAAPLARERRQAFIDQVTTALQDVPVIGPGNLHRAIAEVQRQHFDPPRFSDSLAAPRFGRLR
jgi:hypothetical protein